MTFLLDTNMLSEVLEDPHGRVGTMILTRGIDRVWTSIICQGEMQFELEKHPSRQRAAAVGELFEWIEVRPMHAGVACAYGRVRAELERLGTPIGQNDYWIAAHALAENACAVTANTSEFSRVPGLRVENWLRDPA